MQAKHAVLYSQDILEHGMREICVGIVEFPSHWGTLKELQYTQISSTIYIVHIGHKRLKTRLVTRGR